MIVCRELIWNSAGGKGAVSVSQQDLEAHIPRPSDSSREIRQGKIRVSVPIEVTYQQIWNAQDTSHREGVLLCEGATRSTQIHGYRRDTERTACCCESVLG